MGIPSRVLKRTAPLWSHYDEWSINTVRRTQNGCHFPDNIFLNENVWISIKVSLKFFPKGQIYNIPSLVQMMAWHRPGDKPLSEPMMVIFSDTYASLGLNGLKIGDINLRFRFYFTTIWTSFYLNNIWFCTHIFISRHDIWLKVYPVDPNNHRYGLCPGWLGQP